MNLSDNNLSWILNFSRIFSKFVYLEKILEYFKIQEKLLYEKIIRYKIIKGYTSCCTFPIIFCQKLSFKN